MSERKFFTKTTSHVDPNEFADVGFGKYEGTINGKVALLSQEGSGVLRGIRLFGHSLSVGFGPRPYWVIYISGLRAGTRPTLQQAIDFARKEAAR